MAEAALPGRQEHARVARNHLSQLIHSSARSAETGVGSASAITAADPSTDGNSIQFGYRQRAETVGERKTVWGATDDRTAHDSRFPHGFLNEIEVHGITCAWQFGPLGFKEL